MPNITHLTIEEAEQKVQEKTASLLSAKQDLRIALERSKDFEKQEQVIDKLKIDIESKNKELKKLKDKPDKNLLIRLRGEFKGLLHDHLIGEDSMHEEDLERLYEVLQAL